MDLIITSLPGQLHDIQSRDRLSDNGIVSGTLKIVIPPIKKPQRKVYRYHKGDYQSMRSDALRFAKERYFNGYSDSRSFQENFNLITSFIQDSADKHIPSKTSRSVSSVPWITPAFEGKFAEKNASLRIYSSSQLTLMRSLRSGHLQTLVPYSKKGDRSLACNYRPVSLTCVPCKLLEHIVCSNFMAHLDEHKLLSDKQYAFRK